MQDSQERLRRLAHVATRYYLEDWKQSDIAKELGVPVKFAGVGEGIGDLRPFDARSYVEAII